jgi:hypothetical protein
MLKILFITLISMLMWLHLILVALTVKFLVSITGLHMTLNLRRVMKLPRFLKWRVRLVQKGYDKGWDHGYEAGLVEQKNQIIDLLSSHIEKIDWLQETPIEVKDILPIVKNHQEDKELVGWDS